MPTRDPQPGDKERLIRLAGRAAEKASAAASERDSALVAAAAGGASLRELEAATGLSHMTIKRTIDRATSSGT